MIDAVLNWPSQMVDFVRDGSLRDIYVQCATIEDWKIVVARILHGEYRARLQRDGVTASMPEDFEAVFSDRYRYLLRFSVGNVVLDCHFFSQEEIEFSFGPEEVTESSLRDLLAFMIDVGDATRKLVIMTPENGPEVPIFKYDSNEYRLIWRPSDGGHRR